MSTINHFHDTGSLTKYYNVLCHRLNQINNMMFVTKYFGELLVMQTETDFPLNIKSSQFGCPATTTPTSISTE